MKEIIRILPLFLLFGYASPLKSQDAEAGFPNESLRSHYFGLMPAFLLEPYDTINALEANAIPLVYEFRMGVENRWGVQLRPIANYRFYEPEPGFSQVGGTLLVNRYFTQTFSPDYWLIPVLGLYSTFTYNRLDEIQTLTLGVEPGAWMRISEAFSMTVSLQPGINYYPDQASRDFVESESGFKSHFGVNFQIGYNF